MVSPKGREETNLLPRTAFHSRADCAHSFGLTAAAADNDRADAFGLAASAADRGTACHIGQIASTTDGRNHLSHARRTVIII